MKFKLIGHNNVGHGVTRSLLETIPLSDTSNITFTKDLEPSIEEDLENNTTKLEVLWKYKLLYRGNEFFDFYTIKITQLS